MSNSLDKSLGDKSDAMLRPNSKNKTPNTNDDFGPLLENKSNHYGTLSRYNILNAPIIAGFVKFKEILGENFWKAIYVLFTLTIVFMLAQVKITFFISMQ